MGVQIVEYPMESRSFIMPSKPIGLWAPCSRIGTVNATATWPDEQCHDHATIVLAQAHVDAELHRYDPLAHLTDQPSAQLVSEMNTAYSRLISAVVAQLDVSHGMS
jgi:hypothetical protein